MSNRILSVLSLVIAFICLGKVRGLNDMYDAEYGPFPYYPYSLCRKEADKCDFGFQYGIVPIVSMSAQADKPLTPRIVSKNINETIGIVNSNGYSVDIVFGDFSFPLGLIRFGGQTFSRTQFRPYSIPYSRHSAIGFEAFQRNEHKRLIRNTCIRVFFTQYQILDKYGRRVISNVNGVPRSSRKCVVFEVTD